MVGHGGGHDVPSTAAMKMAIMQAAVIRRRRNRFSVGSDGEEWMGRPRLNLEDFRKIFCAAKFG